MNVDLWLWSGNKGPVIPMEVTWFSTPEEGVAKSQQDQDHVNCVLWLGRCCPSQYTPPGQTINKACYLNVLCCLRDAIWQKQLQLWAAGDWQLHHDNRPAHASRPVQSFLAKHQIIQLTQPHYSPDLAPCDFWLFKKLRLPMKGKRFQTVDEVQENTMGLFVAIPTKDFAVFWTVEEMLGELCEVPQCLLWRGLSCHCPVYSVSCIFFDKCLYFS